MQRTAPEKKDDTQRTDTLIRVEANLEEWPVFAASKKSHRSREVVVWKRQGRDPATGQPVEQQMTLNPSVQHGLPAERERDLYYLVIAPWIETHGFGPKGRIGPIRYQDACHLLGWKRSGVNYDQIRLAVLTLQSLNIEFRHALIDGKTRRLVEYGTHLFSDYLIEADAPALTPEHVQRGQFSLKAADWFRQNWEARYLKPLDRSVYTALRTPLAKALYSYLDKRAYSRGGYRPEVVEDLNELRNRFRLGVRATKNLLQEFRRAHDDLRHAWPTLRDSRLEKIRPGHYRAVYVFSTQVALPLDDDSTADVDAPTADAGRVGESPNPQLVQELRMRGINPARAEQLTRDHLAEHIRHHLDVHDHELKHAGIQTFTNPAGRLYRRITENWDPFDGYKPPQQRDRIQRSQAAALAKKKAEADADAREQAEWNAKTPEEKAADRTNTWAVLQQGLNGQPPTEEQRAGRYAELLRRYQQEIPQS